MLDVELQDSVFPMQGFGFALDWYILASHLFPLMEWKCFLCDSVCSDGIYGVVCVLSLQNLKVNGSLASQKRDRETLDYLRL